MKKVIGILGVAVFAVALFTNTNSVNNKEDINLTALLSQDTANAEGSGTPLCVGTLVRCYWTTDMNGKKTAIMGAKFYKN